jgi:hypothetical protein
VAVVVVNLLLLALLEGASFLVLKRVFPGAARDSRRSEPVEQPFDVLAGWVMAPNTVIRDGGSRIETGPDGFPLVPDPLAQPEFTLVVTGGSTMFGIGVTNNALTVPGQLQTLLRREYGLKVNVVNLAVRGYVGFQEMVTLERWLATHPADGVVSISGYNDATTFLTDSAGPGSVLEKTGPPTQLARRVESGALTLSNLVPWLQRHSYTACLVGEFANRSRETTSRAGAPPADLPRDPAVAARAVRGHAAAYAMMDASCRTRGAVYKMYLQPTAGTKQTLSDAERDALARKDRKRTAEGVQAHRDQQALYFASFRNAEKTFPFLDLTAVMGDTTDTCYTDRCHYTARGGEIIARAVAADLAPLLIARRPVPTAR